MGFISWIILGLIAGALAKWLMPGDDDGGWIMTIVLGVAGAFVGGWLGSFIGLGSADRTETHSRNIKDGTRCIRALAIFTDCNRRGSNRIFF